MNHYEKVIRLFEEKYSEEPLVSVWKHFPHLDRDPNKMAEAHIDFQQTYNPDVMKISPHGRYPCVDFGCQVHDEVDPVTGSTRCKKPIIQEIQDWNTIEEIDPQQGEYGKQLQAIQLLLNEYKGEVPMMFTVFSNMMTASKLDRNLIEHYQDNPKLVKNGLDILYSVLVEYIEIILELGMDGIFLATQHASKDKISYQLFKKLELPYLKRLKQVIDRKNATMGLVMHVHGKDIFFDDIAKQVKPDAINWHDQLTPPSLLDAHTTFKGVLFGGIDETETLRKESIQVVEKQIMHSLEDASHEKRTIMAPGCVIPIDTPSENIKTAVDVTRSYKF